MHVISIFGRARDPVSSLTHMIGAVVFGAGTVALVLYAIFACEDTLLRVIAYLVFGGSLIALYTSSGVYHFATSSEKLIRRLRKLDHAMIYVLIAGTYTPACLLIMPFNQAIIFLSVIWIVALAGILTTIFWFKAPRWFYALLYLLMGWAILFDLPSFAAMPKPGLVLIAAGGVVYSIGAIVYILKKPNFTPRFGFHELFHIFILGGSAMHFAAMFVI